MLLVSEGEALNHGTLHHIGIGVAGRAAVIESHRLALAFGAGIARPPRTTWKCTPLHELGLRDPDGNLIEIYARLREAEMASKPADERPDHLVPGTAPAQ